MGASCHTVADRNCKEYTNSTDVVFQDFRALASGFRDFPFIISGVELRGSRGLRVEGKS